LTRQLLAFSRKQILKPKILDLNAIISGMESMLQRLIGEDIELLVFSPSDLKSIKADPTQIEQVIINLAVNARDAMPDGGTLRIETTNVAASEEEALRSLALQPGDYVLLTVADTGVGMSREAMDRIFEPFYTTKELGKGTGLGLATVYGIVQQSGGLIYPESELGSGAKFSIYLPAIEEGANGDASPSPQAQPGSETILLVEDEELVREVVRDSLEEAGYRILEAGNGEEALKVCEKRDVAIDLMITDVVMPKMNGRELAEKAKVLRPEMKILFISGYTEDTILRQGVEVGAAGFIQKPFSTADLTVRIKGILKEN
jgi:CheY-like chemotaxis protein